MPRTLQFRSILRRLGVTKVAKLGQCAYCMRSALYCATLAWLACALTSFIRFDSIAVGLTVLASAMSFLWLAHLLAFALRRAVRRPEGAMRDAGAMQPNRRQAVVVFLNVFVGAAAATIVPLSVARATGVMKQCTYTYYCLGQNGEKPCCDEDTPFLCHNDCNCYAEVPEDCNSYSKCADECA